ncbi:Hypothetical_protein [Hexamita inflata]|uniref:Hypothetical_protein n=1 Tax=Hexamita inflata TaxID=28002 RepID=A0AA86UVJ0_9EUKA|nr:Hypothetical protein HINF_LOCUS61155 [Hexamita inflata]
MNEQQDVKSQLSSSDDQQPLSQPTPEIISKIFYEAAKNVLSRYFNVQSENMNQSEISNQIDQLNQDQQQTLWEKIVQISNNYFETVEAAQSYFTTTFKSAYQNIPDILEYQPDEQEQLNNLNTNLKQGTESESKYKQVNKTQMLDKCQKFDQFTVALKQVLNQMYSEQNFLIFRTLVQIKLLNQKMKERNIIQLIRTIRLGVRRQS